MSWSRGQRSLTRIEELSTVCHLMAERSGEASAAKLAEQADRFLQAARQAAGPRRPFWGRFGASIDTIETNIHAAVCLMLRYMPLQYLRGWLPELSALIQAHLPAQDPRRAAVEEILRSTHDEEKGRPPIALAPSGQEPLPAQELNRREAREQARLLLEKRNLDEAKREVIISATHAALEAQAQEYVRVRSFRNIVYGATVCLTLLAIILGAVMAVYPTLAPLCFQAETQLVCPTGSAPKPAQMDTAGVFARLANNADYFVIELVGLIAAAVAATLNLRQLRGTSLPYSIPLALALLKLPTGALTAVLGLLLMRGEFVPGLSALDTSAQIIAWAVVFGYAQQLFTRPVDERGQAILNSVGGAEHGTLMDQRMIPPSGAST
jgi:ElaB/YqjD/DUF883 family membrane-anchored ribosome-binding protein